MTPASLLPGTIDPAATQRLFCFPHAGGGTALYYRWQRFLPAGLAMAPMRLPGREDRLAEPPYKSLAQLADDAAAAIRSVEETPFALIGHSLGGYVALEVAERLLADGGRPPQKLIVAACGAPRPGPAKSPLGDLPDEEFLDEVARRYDGIPTAVRSDPDLLAMVLPPLRADMRMIESYDYQPQPPLPIDLLALGGAEDSGVPVHRLDQWRERTSGQFTLRMFPGGHFFLHPPSRRAAGGKESTPAPLASILRALLSDQAQA